MAKINSLCFQKIGLKVIGNLEKSMRMVVRIIWSTFLVVKDKQEEKKEHYLLMGTIIQMAKSLVVCLRKNGYCSRKKQENSSMRLK